MLDIDFEAHNAEVREVWERFREGNPIRVPMTLGLSSRFTMLNPQANPGGVAYEQFLPDKNLPMGGVSKRSAFVIDAAGTVRYAEVKDNPGQLPDFDAIRKILAEI